MSIGSQSPDGDFFDPEAWLQPHIQVCNRSHSPLTGIFLIRRPYLTQHMYLVIARHSPLTGIFLIRSNCAWDFLNADEESQSPDGDFFDPEHNL